MGCIKLPTHSNQKTRLAMKWNLEVGEDGILTFPEDLLQTTGWKEGDVLEWIDRGDGSYELKKQEPLDKNSPN